MHAPTRERDRLDLGAFCYASLNVEVVRRDSDGTPDHRQRIYEGIGPGKSRMSASSCGSCGFGNVAREEKS
jgi:hypothetical protein